MKNCGVSAKRKKRPAKEKVGGNRARTTPGRGVVNKESIRIQEAKRECIGIGGAGGSTGSIQLSIQ
jgi:hypothetical protein